VEPYRNYCVPVNKMFVMANAAEAQRKLRPEAERPAAGGLEVHRQGRHGALDRGLPAGEGAGSQLVGLRVKLGRSSLTAIERTSSGIPSRMRGKGSETAVIWALVGSTSRALRTPFGQIAPSNSQPSRPTSTAQSTAADRRAPSTKSRRGSGGDPAAATWSPRPAGSSLTSPRYSGSSRAPTSIPPWPRRTPRGPRPS
jgi:hypothetical protein